MVVYTLKLSGSLMGFTTILYERMPEEFLKSRASWKYRVKSIDFEREDDKDFYGLYKYQINLKHDFKFPAESSNSGTFYVNEGVDVTNIEINQENGQIRYYVRMNEEFKSLAVYHRRVGLRLKRSYPTGNEVAFSRHNTGPCVGKVDIVLELTPEL